MIKKNAINIDLIILFLLSVSYRDFYKTILCVSLKVLAMSSRSWLSYYYQNRFHLTPLSYESLEYAAGFSSEQCPEGIVAISTNTLRILALEKLGAVFNQVDILFLKIM